MRKKRLALQSFSRHGIVQTLRDLPAVLGWKMGYGLLAVCILMLSGSCRRSVVVGKYAIIPEPVFMVEKNGSFTLKRSVGICFDNLGQNTPSAKYVVESMRKFHFRPRLVGKDEGGCIVFHLNVVPNEEIGDEGYVIEVKSDRVTVAANTEKGIFYGFQTFLQMLPEDASEHSYRNVVLSCCTILDYPRFGWRGCRLDVSPNFLSVKQLKKHLDMMAAYKLNRFYWRLTGDRGWRIEIQHYPQLTDVGAWLPGDSLADGNDSKQREVRGGFYTVEDVREIIDYASQRHIEVVPEIDVDCESFLAAFPRLACPPIDDGAVIRPNPTHTLCLGNDSAMTMFLDVMDEIIELFPSTHMGIACKDADRGGRSSCAICRRKKNSLHLDDGDDLLLWFVDLLSAHLQSNGKQAVISNDMITNSMPGNAVVLSWHGQLCAQNMASSGYDVICCPEDYCNMNVYQSDPKYQPKAQEGLISLSRAYRFNPMPDALPEMSQSHILGAQITLSTDYFFVEKRREYMLLPRLCAFAECLWTPLDRKNWSRFRMNIESHKDRLQYLGFHCCPGSFAPVLHVTQKDNQLQVLLQSESPNTEFYYTLDGSQPTEQSLRYSGAIVFPVGTIFKVRPAYRSVLRDEVYEYKL